MSTHYRRYSLSEGESSNLCTGISIPRCISQNIRDCNFPLEAHLGNDTLVIFRQPSVHEKPNIILPPHAWRQPGRPKTRRIHSGIEGPFGGKRVKRCRQCKQLAHAATTCEASI